MADITRFLFLRHLRANPTAHVRHLRNGQLAHDGTGQAFWFRPLTAALSEVPVDDREQPLLFHGRTADFQDVTVQATITYRVTDPATAATRIDFGIDPDRGAWRATPLEQVGGLLTELAQQHALDLLAGMTLPQALAEGMVALRERIMASLARDPRIPGHRHRASSTCGWSPSGPSPTWSGHCRRRRGSRCNRTPTRPRTSGGRWPSNGSGPSPRTSCRTRSSSPAGRLSSSSRRARTNGSGRPSRPPPAASTPKPGRGRAAAAGRR